MKILILLLSIVCITANAQIRICKTGSSHSITVDTSVDSDRIASVFGAPEQAESYYDAECYQATVDNYLFANLTLSCVGGQLDSFNIKGTGYEVCIHNTYRVKVGDTLADFLRSIPVGEVRHRNLNGETQLYFKMAGSNVFYDSSLILRADTSGKVTNISWFSPV